MNIAQQSAFSNAVDQFEEMLIAVLLGLMTLITFANVVARYAFNSNILWAVEGTVYLFAWLVLLGVGYGIKHSIHIGVDVVVKMFSRPVQKIITLVAVAACILYAVLLLKGSWDYWSPFIGKRAFLETEDIPIANWMQFLADWFNDGERYEKIPRFIPYFVLPISMALITWRFVQAAWHVMADKNELLIASHEAEELMEEAGLNAPVEGENGEAK
jgi:C4-dicarboxylate transporter DctQ subunit